MNLNNAVPYLINLLLGIIGFLLVASYNRTNATLAQLNRDILSMNKDIVSLKLEITELNMKMLTDERVKELIKLELQNK